MLYPVVILEDGVDEPEGPAYLIGRQGLAIKKGGDIFDATVLVPQISALAPIYEEVTWKLPPIGQELVSQVVAFLRVMFARYDTEAVVLLYWSPSRSCYKVAVPKQRACAGGVDWYDKSLRFDDYLLVGTIHSHPAGAYHSGTDECDELFFDGIHITFGYLKHPHHEISSQISVNGRRFITEPCEIMEGLTLTEAAGMWPPGTPDATLEPELAQTLPMPKKLVKKVKEVGKGVADMLSGDWDAHTFDHGGYWRQRPLHRYEVESSAERKPFPAQWVNQVHVLSFREFQSLKRGKLEERIRLKREGGNDEVLFATVVQE